MDANRVEALKLKSAAEYIIMEEKQEEFYIAKEYVMRAQELYPEMEGVSKFLATIEIYVAAATKMENEEIDYYKVLGVEPTDTEDEIRKQYKKLALAFHPDKNDSVGAVGAFQRILEAWRLLSNNQERLAYDARIALINRKTNPTIPTDASTSGFASTPSSVPTNKRKAAQSHKPPRAPTPAPYPAPIGTYWTACPHCKVYYRLDIVYCNKCLRCPECKETYISQILGPPPEGYFPKPAPRRSQKQKSNIDSTKNKPTSSTGLVTSTWNEPGGSNSSANAGVQVPLTDWANSTSTFGMHGSFSQASSSGANFQPGFPPHYFSSSVFQHQSHQQNWFLDLPRFFQPPQRPFVYYDAGSTSVPKNTTSVGDETHQQPNTESNAPPVVDGGRNPENANWDFDLNKPPPADN